MVDVDKWLESGQSVVAAGVFKQAGPEMSAGEGSGEPGAEEPKVESNAKPPRLQALWVRDALIWCCS